MKNFFTILVLMTAWAIEARAQDLAVSTNVLDYVNYGTLNVAASYGVARHWTVDAGVKYNPFVFGEGEDTSMNKQRSISAGARFWPWHVFSGWWMAGGLRLQEYRHGGISTPATSEGDRIGGSLSGGYTYMIGSHLNLDIGLGFWAGYDVYKTYACQNCGVTNYEGDKYFILPADFTVAFTYVF